MRPSRSRLINAARRSMIQRAELRRKLGDARSAFKPGALLSRGKYRVSEKVDDAAQATRQQFKDNRLPIALAAVAGLAWLFRDPIKEQAPRLGRKLRDLFDAGMTKIRPDEGTPEDMEYVEDQDETAE